MSELIWDCLLTKSLIICMLITFIEYSSTQKRHTFYNTETDGLKGSEKSRFILQLLSDYKIKPEVRFPEVKIIEQQPVEIAKDKQIIDKLVSIATGGDPKHRKGFSSSSLTTYVRNPIDFYQQQILDIRDDAEVEEIVEDRSLGTIIHRILELLYQDYEDKVISKQDIDKIRKRSSRDNENSIQRVPTERRNSR